MIRKKIIGRVSGDENDIVFFWVNSFITQRMQRIKIIIENTKNFGYKVISPTFDE